MNKEEYVQAGIDYDEGVARFVGHADMYERFLRQFLADPGYAALEQAMAAGDVEAAFQAAHSLKGVTGNLSLNALYRRLIPLTDALRGEGDLELARTLFPPVQEEYRRAAACIRGLNA